MNAAELEEERRRDPGPTGTEYERDRRERKVRFVLSAVILVSTFFLALMAFLDAIDNTEKTDSIKGCEATRTALTELYQHEIDDLENPDPKTLKLLGITGADLEEITAPQIEEFEDLKATVDPADCAELLE